MTQLTPLYTATLAELDLFCMLTITVMYLIARGAYKRVGRKLSYLLGAIVFLYSLYLVGDAIWAIGEYTGTLTPFWQYVINGGYFLSLSVAPMLWLYYVLGELNCKIKNNRIALSVLFVPAAAMVVLAVTAKYNHLLFYINDLGKYVRGDWFAAFSVINLAYIVVSGIIAAVKVSHLAGEDKAQASIMVIYTLFVTAGGVIQLFVSFNVALIGFTIAMLYYFAFITSRAVVIQHNALVEQENIAKQANRAKTEFLFNMSHDIRTPMNAILGFTDIAARHIDDTARVEDSLVKIKSSGGHLLDLINDVLEMSRIESGRLDVMEAPTDILDCCEKMNPMLNALAIDKSIDYEMNINITDRYVYADSVHLNRVLVNLLTNAFKYTKDGGSVRFCVEQLSSNLDGKTEFQFTVSDTGIGMSPEFIEHIFEQFAREQTSTINKIQGTGLGLAIAKRITDALSGTIEVESEVGKGSKFTLTVPFIRLTEAEIAENFQTEEELAVKETENAVAFEGKCVLLVEDNELNREIAVEILEDEGFKVESAEDGEIAVQKVGNNEKGYYDFILMDIQMPVMDGYEATKNIRAMNGKGEDIPIIALSANAFDSDKEKSVKAGMNAHIAKPINIKELFETIKQFC